MMLSTKLTPMIYSTKTTEQRRLTELISEVDNHPHKDELIQLMNEQIEDDKKTIYLD